MDHNTLVADNASAIKNGFERVFTLERLVNCWAHVHRKISENMKGISDRLKIEILDDIAKIQVIFDKAIFEKAIELFKKKWKGFKNRKVDEFLAYFTTQWCSDRNNGWFEGCAPGLPSHSNALESIHYRVKEDLKGKRFGLIEFLEFLLENTLHTMSMDRAPIWEVKDYVTGEIR